MQRRGSIARRGSVSLSEGISATRTAHIQEHLEVHAAIVERAVARAHLVRAESGLDSLFAEQPPGSVRGPSGVKYDGHVFGLPPHLEPRRQCIVLVESRWFDQVVTATIVISCLAMANSSALDPPGTLKASVLAVAELSALLIFTFEMCVKILACGFMSHPHSYLSDAWNQLDFVVVGMAWLPVFIPAMGHYAALRSARALRPLRTLNKLPGMPALVTAMLQTFAQLGPILIILSFFMLTFGVLGVELFGGATHYHCISAEAASPDETARASRHQRRLLLPGRVLKGGGGGESDVASICNPSADPSLACGIGEACKYLPTVADSSADFDAITGAFLQIGQTITFDTWTPGMYDVMKATSGLASMYYIAIALFAGFFLVNLFLAIVFDEASTVCFETYSCAALPYLMTCSFALEFLCSQFMRCKALDEAQLVVADEASIQSRSARVIQWWARTFLLQRRGFTTRLAPPSPPASPPTDSVTGSALLSVARVRELASPVLVAEKDGQGS